MPCSPAGQHAAPPPRRAPPTRARRPSRGTLGADAQVHQRRPAAAAAPRPAPAAAPAGAARPTCAQLSSDGVALPSTRRGALEPGAHRGHLARVVARRLAVLVGGLVLLVHDDDAEVRRPARRPPSARPPPPAAPRGGARRQASARSPSESPLCSTATSSPKTPRTRRTVCGVRPISGTSMIAPLPLGQRAADRLEVHQRLAAAGDAEEQRALARRERLDRRERAAADPRVSASGGGVPASPAKGSRARSTSSMPRQSARRPAPRISARAEPELGPQVRHRGAAAQLLQRLVERALSRRAARSSSSRSSSVGALAGQRPAPARSPRRRRCPAARSAG